MNHVFSALRKLTLPLTVLLITLPAVWSLMRSGYFSMFDDMQVIRLSEMHKCVTDLQIPCRWVPDLGLGYGYPLYVYYAPFPYYFMEIFHLLGVSLIDSVKTGFILSVLLSAIFFYMFARYHFSKRTSALLAFLWTYIPFRAGSIYVRGAMGEAWGLVMVPLVFWAFEYFLDKKDLSSKIIFSLSISMFLLTHNLSVLMFLPFILLWWLISIKQEKSKIKQLKSLTLFLLLGLGLSAFFLFPLLFERNLVHLETLTSGYFGFREHFLSLKQIFWIQNWGYGPSVLGPDDEVFLGIGPVHAFLAAAGASVLLLKRNKKKFITALFLFLTFLLTAFLSHPKSILIWNILKLDILQFPWRFISVSMFISSFLAGYFFDALPKKLYLPGVIIFVSLIVFLYFPFFKPKDWFLITDNEKLTGENLKKQLTASIYDYLPKSASKAPDEIAPSGFIPLYATNLESFDLKNMRKGSNWIKYDIEMKGTDLTIAVPVYDFPVWKITVNGEEKTYKRYGPFGLPSFTLEGDGLKRIGIRLTKTWDRILGDAITLGSLAVIFLLLAYEKTSRKYFKG